MVLLGGNSAVLVVKVSFLDFFTLLVLDFLL